MIHIIIFYINFIKDINNNNILLYNIYTVYNNRNKIYVIDF